MAEVWVIIRDRLKHMSSQALLGRSRRSSLKEEARVFIEQLASFFHKHRGEITVLHKEASLAKAPLCRFMCADITTMGALVNVRSKFSFKC